MPLGKIANSLREAVDPSKSDPAYRTRALAIFLKATPENMSRANFTANLDLLADIMLSSWVKVNCYDLDFGLRLGKPEVVRRQQFVPVESLFCLMPKKRDGEIAVALCLRDEDLEKLRDDNGFARYGSFVG